MVNNIDFGDKFSVNIEKKEPKMVNWVIKYSGGLVKDAKQANYVLLALSAIFVLISLALFFGGSSSAGPSSGAYMDPGVVGSEVMPNQ